MTLAISVRFGAVGWNLREAPLLCQGMAISQSAGFFAGDRV
jgi:hypothetical protein